MEEKAKQTSTTGAATRTATARTSQVKEPGSATSRWSAAKTKVMTAVKVGEEAKTIGSRRTSTGASGAITSRVTGRASARPTGKDDKDGSPKRTAGQAEGTSGAPRVRGSSANKDKDL